MKKMLYVVLMITSIVNTYAQTTIPLDVPRVVPISPTATAMEKYLSYPVDHCTGIPNITIPLYEIVAGEVTIPVSLSYHASGLKPKDGSTLAGTGWTLNLEPSVTRQICGVDDDSYYGWFNDPHKQDYSTDDQGIIGYYNQLVDNIRDTQPDKISYKLPNGGGSGYFIEPFRFLSIPRNNDKVEYNHSEGVRITDANGVVYNFNGEKETAGGYTTRWLCKSIWSPNNSYKALVNFSYYMLDHRTPPSHYYNLDNKVVVTLQDWYDKQNIFTLQTTNQNRHYSINYSLQPGPGIQDATLTPISEYQAQVYYPRINRFIDDNMIISRLEQVSFLGNKLSVFYKVVGSDPNNTEVLDRIEVVNKDGMKVRNIVFYITPYNSGTKLTKLDSVIISAPGVESRKYAFDYYDPSSVPSTYTVAVDHWGFCNGSESRSEPTVPSFKRALTLLSVNGGIPGAVMLNFQGANREPNHEWTKTGVLTNITDPQGITTKFIYEGNFGAFRNNSNYYAKDYLHPVGGLRIKRIETIDSKTHHAIYKNYTYGLTRHDVPNFQPVWGGGAIKHIVTIRDYTSSVKYRKTAYEYSYLTTYNSMPESNISFNGGSAVMYNVVIEETTNWTDNAKTKTKYTYNVKSHDFEDILNWDSSDPGGSVQQFLSEQPETIMQQLTRKMPGHRREPSDDYVNFYAMTNQFYGAPVTTEHFRNNKLASSTKYGYKSERVWWTNIELDLPHRRIIGDTEGLRANDVFTLRNYYPAGQSDNVQTTYYLDTESYRALDKEITSQYYDIEGGQDVITTERQYNYHFDLTDPGSSLKPRRIETINSDKTVIIDSLDYLTGYPAMLSRHKRIENNNWKESRILFKPNSNLPEKIQFRTNRMPSFRDEVKYNEYDSYGNVIEIMGKDGKPVTFVWGYQRQFPVAKIENATAQQVYSGSGIFQGSADYPQPPLEMWSRIEQLRTELPNAQITKYEYKPLQGVVAITDPNNITTRFEYDHYGRLTDKYFLDAKSPSDIRKVMLQKYIYKFGE
ncbi:YD repeat-containing protein [Arcticibacter tournemirensis]|uniref:RHS repeat protein n=1 Tax=Arcticibacter tournemirensis TaxID=699437 RepID=A0A5M9GQW5_9SPHI|nr:RHS repeat protein [Arcticibacter tournemirensis]KAA8476145.1 RHS repeat protein [Arcticibacter tournemirensis]TQM50841.1 YD repeat-containing protein [Arcticibacter tournemirensis]